MTGRSMAKPPPNPAATQPVIKPLHVPLVRAEVADCGLEWCAYVDRIQELLPHLDGEPRLRPASEPCSGGVVLRSRHRSQSQPSSHRVRVPCAA
jgi:hypothetical protein